MDQSIYPSLDALLFGSAVDCGSYGVLLCCACFDGGGWFNKGSTWSSDGRPSRSSYEDIQAIGAFRGVQVSLERANGTR